MAENCVCHINGYRLKDTEARRVAADAAKDAEAAKKAADNAEASIRATATVANQAKSAADSANVTARTAYTTAESAERKADEAASGALQRKGGTMLGDIDMGRNNVENVRQVNVLEGVSFSQNDGFSITVATRTEPGVLGIWCGKNVENGVNQDGRAILRGVADPVQSNDATPKKWVEEQLAKKGETPDWLQNDPAANDYIKNRTHYEEEVTEEVTLQFDVFYPSEIISELQKNIKTAKFLVDGVEFVWVREGTTIPGVTFPCWISDGVTEYKITTAHNSQTQLKFASSINQGKSASVTYSAIKTYTHKLDPKYLPPEVAARKPLLLDADSAETYLNDPTPGDEALEAIKTGRQILVRVPNASGDNYVASYSPVYMYQVPNQQNDYLYLFFLTDEKNDLSALLGQPAGTVLMPVYGQLKMKLSQEYNHNPLET